MRMRVAMLAVCAAAHVVGARAATLADPTRPSRGVATGEVEVVPSGPVLQATRVSAQHRSAIISGRNVKIGDSFDGATVVDIAPYEVRMNRAGRETVLRLAPRLAKEKGRAQ